MRFIYVFDYLGSIRKRIVVIESEGNLMGNFKKITDKHCLCLSVICSLIEVSSTFHQFFPVLAVFNDWFIAHDKPFIHFYSSFLRKLSDNHPFILSQNNDVR